MNCKVCGCELRVHASRDVEEAGEMFSVLDLICVNPRCVKSGMVCETLKHQHPAGTQEKIPVKITKKCECGNSLYGVVDGVPNITETEVKCSVCGKTTKVI